MWTQTVLFIVVFLFLYLFEPSTSSGRVSVHLLEYHRSSDEGCKGGGFFFSKSPPCALQFIFCLRGLSDKDSCPNWSDQYKGKRDVTFGKSINGGIANPIVKSFTTLQTGAAFEVKVGDEYWASPDPLPLDNWTTPLPPSHNGATITLTNKNARLTLIITVTCDPHYYGPSCSVRCNPGSADHYTCGPDGTKHCIEGYTGSSCQQTPCHNVACNNGGTCVVAGSTFNCSCPSGISGTHCEITTCTKNPCQNKGTCHFNGPKVTCSCPSGFTGTHCETAHCTSNFCQNGGTCHVVGPKATCSCKSGFNGPLCETTRCTKSPCHNGGTCHVVGSKATCSCKSGFNGPLCETTRCTKSPCHNGGTCHVVGSKATCSCKSGFNGPLCETTPCTKSPCQNQGTCHVVASKATCSCKSGFNGPLCETTPCTKSPCQNQGTCHVVGSKATCSCKSGFNGPLCETTSCTKSPCHNGGTCHVVGSKAICSCKSGFNGPLCETTPCTKSPCQNQGTCHFTGSVVTCSCSPGYKGMYCDVVSSTKEVTPSMITSSTDRVLPHLPTPTGCPQNISNCEFAECPDLTPVRCVRCRAGYTEVDGRCMACPPRTPILHCEEEQSVGCLFRWCSRCDQGFYREASACELCPRLHAGCHDHVCSSADDVRCISCLPGFFLTGNTCKECPSPNPMCDQFTCSDSNDVTCTKCKDGFLEVGGQCLLCPSTSLIPDCVDVARDGCFKHWCRKCAPGFFISGTACDVCPSPGVGCELAECNSTQDSRCVKCFYGYDLKGGICTHSPGNESATISTQCVDNPHVDCASLHSTVNVCSEPTMACEYWPRYCNICNTCTQSVPIIG